MIAGAVRQLRRHGGVAVDPGVDGRPSAGIPSAELGVGAAGQAGCRAGRCCWAKYLGVVAFVAFQAAVYSSHLAGAGIPHRVWLTGYLAGRPACVAQFCVNYSFRGAAGGVYAEHGFVPVRRVLFWGVCWAMNLGRHLVVAMPVGGADAATLRPSRRF